MAETLLISGAECLHKTKIYNPEFSFVLFTFKSSS
jgi:hypothetical protein